MESVVESESAAREAHPVANSGVELAWSGEGAPQDVRICLVPVEVVGVVLEEVMGWVLAAFDRTAFVSRPLERVRENLETGRYRLMLAAERDQVKAAAVVEVSDMDGRPVLFVVAAGGERNGTLEAVAPQLWAGLVDLARSVGVASVVTVGREGWYRWVRRRMPHSRVRMRQVLVEAEV